MLEAVLAIFLIYGFLMVLSSAPEKAEAPQELKLKAYELLQGLDDAGVLRSLAAANDYAAINAAVDYSAKNHSVSVCEPDGTCHGSAPTAGDVWVGTYALAGDSAYSPKLVKLYLY